MLDLLVAGIAGGLIQAGLTIFQARHIIIYAGLALAACWCPSLVWMVLIIIRLAAR